MDPRYQLVSPKMRCPWINVSLAPAHRYVTRIWTNHISDFYLFPDISVLISPGQTHKQQNIAPLDSCLPNINPLIYVGAICTKHISDLYLFLHILVLSSSWQTHKQQYIAPLNSYLATSNPLIYAEAIRTNHMNDLCICIYQHWVLQGKRIKSKTLLPEFMSLYH